MYIYTLLYTHAYTEHETFATVLHSVAVERGIGCSRIKAVHPSRARYRFVRIQARKTIFNLRGNHGTSAARHDGEVIARLFVAAPLSERGRFEGEKRGPANDTDRSRAWTMLH